MKVAVLSKSCDTMAAAAAVRWSQQAAHSYRTGFDLRTVFIKHAVFISEALQTLIQGSKVGASAKALCQKGDHILEQETGKVIFSDYLGVVAV